MEPEELVNCLRTFDGLTEPGIVFRRGDRIKVQTGLWPFIVGDAIQSLRIPDILRAVAVLVELPDRTASETNILIEATQLAVLRDDDDFLSTVQHKLYRLGLGWKTRAQLAEYLYPLPTGHRYVSPLDRLRRICSYDRPEAIIRKAVHRWMLRRRLDAAGRVRIGGDTAMADETAAIELGRDSLARHFSARWRIKVDWDEIAKGLDPRTAQELRQVRDGATVAEMGAKNYKHFRRRLPKIRGLIVGLRRPSRERLKSD